MLSVDMMTDSLFANGNDGFGFDGFVSRAAFGIKEAEQFLQRVDIRGASQERALARYRDQFLVLELVQMMRQVRCRQSQFFLYFSDDHAVGMGGKQELH